MKCQNCDCGQVVIGWQDAPKVTREMAIDAGNEELEGLPLSSGDYIWDVCQCCGGYFEDCPNCSSKESK
jgi:hypothetical protein